jgi:hypothetical protein
MLHSTKREFSLLGLSLGQQPDHEQQNLEFATVFTTLDFFSSKLLKPSFPELISYTANWLNRRLFKVTLAWSEDDHGPIGSLAGSLDWVGSRPRFARVHLHSSSRSHTESRSTEDCKSPLFLRSTVVFLYRKGKEYKNSTLADDTYPQGLMGRKVSFHQWRASRSIQRRNPPV